MDLVGDERLRPHEAERPLLAGEVFVVQPRVGEQRLPIGQREQPAAMHGGRWAGGWG